MALAETVEHWSLTTLWEKLVKIGAKVVRHGRSVTFQLAEVAVPKELFRKILRLIDDLRRSERRGVLPDIGERAMDVLDRADLRFPHSVPEFQRLFPDDAACAAYVEKARWGDGFACPHCGTAGEPFHFENRPGVLSCRKCYARTPG